MRRVLPCWTVITGTAVSFVAVDPSSHQLQEPQYWPTFCRNMFYAVLWCSGSHLYDHRGNWRQYSPSHIRLYSVVEWRHCRANAVVLGLWETQEERLGWEWSLRFFLILVLGGFMRKAFTYFRKSCLCAFVVYMHQKCMCLLNSSECLDFIFIYFHCLLWSFKRWLMIQTLAYSVSVSEIIHSALLHSIFIQSIGNVCYIKFSFSLPRNLPLMF